MGLTAGIFDSAGGGGQFFVSGQSLPQDGSDAQLSVDPIFCNPWSNYKTTHNNQIIIMFV